MMPRSLVHLGVDLAEQVHQRARPRADAPVEHAAGDLAVGDGGALRRSGPEQVPEF